LTEIDRISKLFALVFVAFVRAYKAGIYLNEIWKQVMNIHHRPSGSDGVTKPYPGFLSGGPNTVTFADCPDINRSKFPAKSFVDAECSYSTNEVAINWNAPLFFVLGAMDSLNN